MFWKKKSKYDGIFSDWEIGYSRLYKDKYCLLIGCGFLSFGDDMYESRTAFLYGLSIWDKWLLWREFRREMKRRLKRYYDTRTAGGETIEDKESQ